MTVTACQQAVDVTFTLPSGSLVHWHDHVPFGRVRSDFDKICNLSTPNFNIHFHAGFGNLFIHKSDKQGTIV
ncbi:hypothetical protein [Cardinium endosymbiont of Tipula unca]|uniref:hypothetical protein n=1 Tax=Cardinium endosymbiont of Tipula unca TaxID=3066216 RepID=UPI0030CF961F